MFKWFRRGRRRAVEIERLRKEWLAIHAPIAHQVMDDTLMEGYHNPDILRFMNETGWHVYLRIDHITIGKLKQCKDMEEFVKLIRDSTHRAMNQMKIES